MDHETGSLTAGERLRNLERDMRQVKDDLVSVRLELKAWGAKLTVAFAIVSFVAFALVEIIFKK